MIARAAAITAGAVRTIGAVSVLGLGLVGRIGVGEGGRGIGFVVGRASEEFAEGGGGVLKVSRPERETPANRGI